MGGKIEFIKKLDFFSSLDSENLRLVSSISMVTKHPKNAILYYENDTHNKLFFLVSGLLKIYKIDKFDNEIFLYHIYQNSLVSELTTIDSSDIHCFANAEILEDSIILEVDFVELKRLFLSNNLLNSQLINELLLKTSQLHCVVNRELVFDATSKVAYMLCDDLRIFNRLKRQEVSFMLHIQPETLSRILKKLKRLEIIDVDNSEIVIKNIDTLKKIYQGE